MEAVDVSLEIATEMCTLEDILAETGYSPVEGNWVVVHKPERHEMSLSICL